MHDLTSLIERLPRAVPLPARARRRWTPSLVWLVPALVVMLGLGFGARALWLRGPTITIRFATAEGLEAHKTTIRYKNVPIGVVTSIDLLEDRSGVLVSADIARQARLLLVDDARFWVVRPRVSTAGVSGIGTLLTGAQIGFDAGVSERSRHEFVGLEAPPSTVTGRPGRRFDLRADNLGSIDVGTPVYLRRFQVGQVTRVALGPRGDAADVEVFIDAPYDRHVAIATRFWNASGVDVTMDLRGIQLDTQSLASVLMGGIAFETPRGTGPDAPAPEGAEFWLYSDRRAALPETGNPADNLPAAVNRLVSKLSDMPYDRLAREGALTMRQMRRTLKDTSRLVRRVDRELAPQMTAMAGQATRTLGSVEQTLASDAPLQRELRTTLRDLGGAGQSLRVLTDYLERHPESLIFGKKKDRP